MTRDGAATPPWDLIRAFLALERHGRLLALAVPGSNPEPRAFSGGWVRACDPDSIFEEPCPAGR